LVDICPSRISYTPVKNDWTLPRTSIRPPLGTRNPAPNTVLLTLSALFGGIYLIFHRLRIELDYRGVRLSYGLMTRTIPYLDIERVELSNIGVMEYGGLGYKQNHRGDVAYSVRRGEAVKLVTRSKGPVLFTPQEPRRVVSLINEMGSFSTSI